MNEKQTASTVRPTKKQRELLTFIDEFIGQHGYSPSYREIMNGLNYTSVATVSLHVNSLIRRGHLRKRDRSARSLEVVQGASSSVTDESLQNSPARAEAGAAWLVQQVEQRVTALEQSTVIDEKLHAAAEQLVAALRILGHGTAENFAARIARLAPETVETDDRTPEA